MFELHLQRSIKSPSVFKSPVYDRVKCGPYERHPVFARSGIEMTNQSDFNQQIIAEFRANDGAVGGPLAGRPLLLLTTVGNKSGNPRTTPLGYQMNGDRLLVFASNLGARTHPAWFRNVLAHPGVVIEVGDERFDSVATVADGDERARLWAEAVAAWPFLIEHQERAKRDIPIVVLEPRRS
jgi:deazaflavin-dependent oxidoreductase (nitroreductase family)